MNYLLILIIYILMFSHLMFFTRGSIFKPQNFLVFSYVAGVFYYSILPISLFVFFDYTFSIFRFLSSLPAIPELSFKILLIVMVFLFFSLVGLWLGKMNLPNNKLKSSSISEGIYIFPPPGYYKSDRVHKFMALFVFIFSLSLIISIYSLAEGVYVSGERGSKIGGNFHMLLDSLLIVSAALALDSREGKKSVYIILFLIFIIYFLQSVFISGSRRILFFYILFLVIPVINHLRPIKKIIFFLLIIATLPIIAILGVTRKMQISISSLDDFLKFISNVWLSLYSNFDLLILNLDFAIVFDAFVGIVIKVPDSVDYLYGSTLSKFFVFFIPRSIWNEKPESISVVVSKNIYDLDSTLVSFNPSLIGELFYNGGMLVVAIVAIICGYILSYSLFVSKKWMHVNKLSNIFILGILCMTFFNLFRGYTFEVVLNFCIVFLLFKLLGKLTLSKSRL